MPTLIGQSGPLAGRRFELDGDVVLGRENAAITLADEETSRRHAEIRVTVDVVVIEDLGSTNGTYVDGRRIAAATQLRGGEIIKMGQSTFTLEVEVAPEPVPAPEPDRGATRIVKSPEPVDDPDKTAMRQRPPAPSPEPIADPDVTALRPRPPAPPPPPPPPVVDPGHTQLRPRPPKRPPAPEPVADAPDRTALRPRPPAREPAPPAPAPPPPAPPARAPASRRAAAAPKPAADQPFGAFSPAGSRRRRGVATRKVTPALVSMATIITTAAALVVYFAGR